jgi:hypothetical protein
MKVYVGDKLIHYHDVQSLNFDLTRYYLSFFDYAENRRNNLRYKTTYISPNNKHTIYKINENNGVYDLKEGDTLAVALEVADYAGNKSILRFVVAYDSKPYSECISQCKEAEFALWDRGYFVRDEDYGVYIPENSLFDNCCITSSKRKGKPTFLSPIIRLGDPDIPVYGYFDLTIKVTEISKISQYDKLLIAEVVRSGLLPRGGMFEDGVVTSSVRAFGEYVIVIDTLPPTITAKNWKPGAILASTTKSLSFTIRDNLSGVKNYNAWLNNEWVLMEYDAKTNTLSYYRDSDFSKGNHVLHVEVVDERGNSGFSEFLFRIN